MDPASTSTCRERARERRARGRRRQFGNMLLSRTPLLTVRHHLLPKYASLGPPMSLQRSALEGVIAIRGGHVRVYSVHLTHLSGRDPAAPGRRVAPGARGCGSRGSAGVRERSARGVDTGRYAGTDAAGRDSPRRLQHGAGLGGVRTDRGTVLPLRRPRHESGRVRRRLGRGRKRHRSRRDGRRARPSGPPRLLLRRRGAEGIGSAP